MTMMTTTETTNTGSKHKTINKMADLHPDIVIITLNTNDLNALSNC